MSILRRMGWGFGDQALSSLSNFALGVLVARVVSAEEFGAFSRAFSTYLLVMGVSRSVTSDPLVVRFSAGDIGARREAIASANGAALAIGLLGAVGVVAASTFLRPEISGAFLALGLTLPGLLVQDGWRFAFFAGNEGSKAFANDLVWAIVLALMAGALVVTGRSSAFAFTLSWGASATVAAVYGLVQSKILPRPGRTTRWLRDHRDLALPFLGQFGALIGGAQLSVYAIASIVGIAAAGAFRAAGILLGPVTMFYRGVRLSALPAAVRLVKRSPEALRGRIGALAAALGLGTMAWGIVLLLIPDELGTALLGETWSGARSILLPITVSVACGGVVSGLEMGLRALAAAKRSFRARIVLAPLTVGATVIGALVNGAVGAAWAQAIGMVIGMGIWAWHFDKALHEADGGIVPEVLPDPLDA